MFDADISLGTMEQELQMFDAVFTAISLGTMEQELQLFDADKDGLEDPADPDSDVEPPDEDDDDDDDDEDDDN